MSQNISAGVGSSTCPRSRCRVAGALAGQLSIMVGGDRPAVAPAETVLAHLASRVTHVGDSGAGQTVKLINQVLVGIGFSAVAEIAAMARAAHLEPQADVVR